MGNARAEHLTNKMANAIYSINNTLYGRHITCPPLPDPLKKKEPEVKNFILFGCRYLSSRSKLISVIRCNTLLQ